MRLHGTLFIAASLVTVSLIPQGVVLYQFIYNGGLDWPMLWGNETVAWGAIFSSLAWLALLMAFKTKRSSPKGSAIIMLFASIIIVHSLYALVSPGLDPASKGDDEALQLMAFWSSGWWK